MHLANAFAVERGDTVALIGAGGKTTTLYRLARELCDDGRKVLVTTTTKIFRPTRPHVDRLFLVHEVAALLTATSEIPAPVIISAGYGVNGEGKLLGLPVKWLDEVETSGQFDNILVEADGAASRLFKVPSEIEPVIPESTHVVVWIMAIKVLGKPMQPNWVHRVERATAILGVSPEAPITREHILSLVRHPAGCLKGVPAQARKIALINQVDTAQEHEHARELGKALLPCGFERVLISSFLSHEPIKEIIRN